MSASVSGLSEAHRAQARELILHGVQHLMEHPGSVHYTQGASRWSGIDQHKTDLHHILPFYGDCSSTATWLLWRAFHFVHPGMRDLVNGENWRAGYTGTIADHGKRVVYDASIKVGDLILYGPAPTYSHVAVSIGGRRVFSHGSEGGPYILDMDYRGDRGPTRRFI